jgi:hypothetical protein
VIDDTKLWHHLVAIAIAVGLPVAVTLGTIAAVAYAVVWVAGQL